MRFIIPEIRVWKLKTEGKLQFFKVTSIFKNPKIGD